MITGGAGLKMDNECLKVTAMILGYAVLSEFLLVK